VGAKEDGGRKSRPRPMKGENIMFICSGCNMEIYDSADGIEICLMCRGVVKRGNNKMKIHCTNCGYEGEIQNFIKGSIITELFLYLMFLLPGIIYSIWRLSSRYKGCPKCKWENVVPLEELKGF